MAGKVEFGDIVGKFKFPRIKIGVILVETFKMVD